MSSASDFLWILPPALVLGFFVFLNVRNRRKAARMSDFARSRGWRCIHSRGPTGPGARYTKFVLDAGDGWELRTRKGSMGQYARMPGKTEFRSASPRFPGEFVLFAGRGGEKAVAALMRFVGRVFGKTLMSLVCGKDMGRNLGRLRSYEAPEGIQLAVLATVDPRARFDLEAISRAIDGIYGGRLRLSACIGDHGLHVTAEFSELKIPGEGEDFLAGCLALRDLLATMLR